MGDLQSSTSTSLRLSAVDELMGHPNGLQMALKLVLQIPQPLTNELLGLPVCKGSSSVAAAAVS